MEAGIKKKRPWWRRALRGLAITVVILVVAVVLVHTAGNYFATRRLRDEIARIERSGEPLTFADLKKKMPEVAAQENAGRYYEAATALVRHENWEKVSESLSNELKKEPKGEPNVLILRQVEEYLAENAEALVMLDCATALEKCQFDFNVEMGMGGAFVKCRKFKELARLLLVRTDYWAWRGEADKAVESVISELRIGRVFQNQPVLVIFLVKLAIEGLASYNIPRVLEQRCRPSDAALHKLQEEIKAIEEKQEKMRLAEVLAAERVYALTWLLDLPGGDWERNMNQYSPILLPPMNNWLVSGTHWPLIYMGAGQIRDMDRFIMAAKQPWPEVLDATEAARKSTVSLLGKKLMAPSMVKTISLAGRGLVFLRCARMAVMIERYTSEKGRRPATLWEAASFLGEAVPIDPFTGQELLYKTEAKEYRVYSAGDNRQDDQGDIFQNTKSNDRGLDLGLRVKISAELYHWLGNI